MSELSDFYVLFYRRKDFWEMDTITNSRIEIEKQYDKYLSVGFSSNNLKILKEI